MEPIQITVTGANAAVTKTVPLTTGLVGQPVTFRFDSAWDGLRKTAVFRAGGKVFDMEKIEDSTTVPPEVLEDPHISLYIGVRGTNAAGTLTIPTVWASVGVILPGTQASGDKGTDVDAVYQAGYTDGQADMKASPVELATPSITVSDTGTVTASVTQRSGYVNAQTRTNAYQMTTQGEQTIVPGTQAQSIPGQTFLTGTQTVQGDGELLPENIVSGVSIFGVEGSATVTIGNSTGRYPIVVGMNYISYGRTGKIMRVVTENSCSLSFVLLNASSASVASTVKLLANNQTRIVPYQTYCQMLTDTNSGGPGMAIMMTFVDDNAELFKKAEYIGIFA